MVLWACSSKRGKFRHFTGTAVVSRVSRVSRLSKVMAGIRVSVRIKVSLVVVIEWRYDFPTLREWTVELYVGFPTCSHSQNNKQHKHT